MSRKHKPPPNAVMPQVRQISVEGINNTFKMLGGIINNATDPYRRHDNYKIGKRSIPLPRLGKSNRKALITEKQLQAAIKVMLAGGHSHGKIAQALSLNGATWREKPTPDPKLISELTKKRPNTPQAVEPIVPHNAEHEQFLNASPPEGHAWSELTLDDMAVQLAEISGTVTTPDANLSWKQGIAYRIARTSAYAELIKNGHLLRYRPTPTTPYQYRFTTHAVEFITKGVIKSAIPAAPAVTPTPQPQAPQQATPPTVALTPEPKVATRAPEAPPLDLTAALNTLIRRHNILLTLEGPALKVSLEQFIINAATATRENAAGNHNPTFIDAVNELTQRHGTTLPLEGPELRFNPQRFIINLEVSTRPATNPAFIIENEEGEEEPDDQLPF